MEQFKRYRFKTENELNLDSEIFQNTERSGNNYETYSFCDAEKISNILSSYAIGY